MNLKLAQILKYLLKLVILIKLINCQQSPCPNIFQYSAHEAEDEAATWYGHILLTSEDVTLKSIWVDIELDRQALLLGNWYGVVSNYNNNTQFTLTNRNDTLYPGISKTIKIFVKYNELEPIPHLRAIFLNGRQICPDPKQQQTERPTNTQRPTKVESNESTTKRVQNNKTNSPQNHASNNQQASNSRPQGSTNSKPNSNTVTNTKPTGIHSGSNLINTVYTTSNTHRPNFLITNASRPNYLNTDPTRPNYNLESTTKFNWITLATQASLDEDEGYGGDFKPGDLPIAPRPNEDYYSDNNQAYDCGTVVVHPKPLITYGQSTLEGQWPWHAAIYQSKGIDLSYICGASLIGTKYVVTAAHCVAKRQSESPVNRDTLLVYLGKFNLKKWSSRSIQNIQVDSIFIHPNYSRVTFDNDIAVLRLQKSARVTDYVRPVCLWSENPELYSVAEREGTVVGWGYDETGHVTEELTQAKMPVVSQEQCIRSNPAFFSRFTSDRTFCAGFRNGTSVCNGDSGGGMVFPMLNSNPVQWQIRGIVSISVALQNEFICDPKHYVVFTDLAKHLDWILTLTKY